MTVIYDPTEHYEINLLEEVYRLGQDGNWSARIYQPQGDGPFPVLLDVHGGAWSTGSYLNNEDIDRALAASGILVVAIEFRQAPQHVYPAQVADVNFGTRWLKKRAADFGGDPTSVGALGTSSRGHSLMLSVLKPNDTRYKVEPLEGNPVTDATVRYVITGWPVLDSHARYIYAKNSGIKRLMKSSENYFGDEETMREGNPQLVLERGEQTALPPVLILQGTKDDNIPLEISERFVKTYQSIGGDIKRMLFPDMPHAFTREPGPETDQAVDLMKTFIAQQLKKR